MEHDNEESVDDGDSGGRPHDDDNDDKKNVNLLNKQPRLMCICFVVCVSVMEFCFNPLARFLTGFFLFLFFVLL